MRPAAWDSSLMARPPAIYGSRTSTNHREHAAGSSRILSTAGLAMITAVGGARVASILKPARLVKGTPMSVDTFETIADHLLTIPSGGLAMHPSARWIMMRESGGNPFA